MLIILNSAFGKHFEEKYVTWAQFGKKQDKNATLQDFDEALDLQCVETASKSHLTPSKIKADDVTTICDDVKGKAIWLRGYPHSGSSYLVFRKGGFLVRRIPNCQNLNIPRAMQERQQYQGHLNAELRVASLENELESAYNEMMLQQENMDVELWQSKKNVDGPETFEGICGMGDRCITHLCKPTRELSEIIGSLYAARIGGYLLLLDAVTEAHGVWFSLSGKKLGGHLPKRIVVFAGGFGDPAENKHELFDTLIAVADKNGNCNVLHVPPESSVCDSLLRSLIIPHVGVSDSLASLSV
ncbi:hypothetical protein Tco_1145347 [Tanacetum coccineum]